MLRNFLFKNKKKPPARQYDKIVSIGSNCEVTWNIRNHFKTDEAYPFDWWMTPFHSLLELLGNNFSGLFEANNIYIPSDRGTVVDKKYNLMYHHDFLKDSNGLVVLDRIDEQLAELKKKYEFLATRFTSHLDGKEVLFIRNRCGNDSTYLNGDYGDLQPEHCIEIHEKLASLFPNTKFDILATNKPGFEFFRHANSEIFCDSIVDFNDCDDYMVSPKGWAEMFERNNIKLRRKSGTRR